MNQPQFQDLQEKIFENCATLTRSKGQDYTKGNVDVLHHFKDTALSLGVTPLQVCAIFMKKHFDALYNYVKTNGQSESEPIETRALDAINYITFMQALIAEEQERLKESNTDLFGL